MNRPDLRYNVISSIAKRDLAWAAKLREQLLQEQARAAKESEEQGLRSNERTAERWLGISVALVATDPSLAINFAQASLRYPATPNLSQFIYKLAGFDKAMADHFYQGLEQRAYLYSMITEETLKTEIDQTQAREMLEEAVSGAVKATPSMISARTLLNSAYLYSRIDMHRAISVLGKAVGQINLLEQVDFSHQFVTRKIEGNTFSVYGNFSTPGFTPENAFRAIGAKDFDGMLAQTGYIQHKPLRSSATLALIEPCLKQITEKPKRSTKTTGN